MIKQFYKLKKTQISSGQSSIGIANANIIDNSNTDTQKAIDSNNNSNSKIKHSKFINFLIYNIIRYIYSIQFTIKMIELIK